MKTFSVVVPVHNEEKFLPLFLKSLCSQNLLPEELVLIDDNSKEFLICRKLVTNKVKIKSFKTRICDIYRPFKDNYYEQYLISSHLLSLKFNLRSLKSIPYFIRWLIHRKIKLISFSLIIVKV